MVSNLSSLLNCGGVIWCLFSGLWWKFSGRGISSHWCLLLLLSWYGLFLLLARVIVCHKYFDSLIVAAFLAAALASAQVKLICESAKMSGTVTSQARGLPLAHGINVTPTGRFPPCVARPTGSLWGGTCALFIALQIASLSIARRCCLEAPTCKRGHGSPWRPPSYHKSGCGGASP